MKADWEKNESRIGSRSEEEEKNLKRTEVKEDWQKNRRRK